MDDWLTILLAFVFFVLPLLEGIFKKSKQNRTPGTPPDYESADFEDGQAGQDYFPADVDAPPSGEAWSEGWGSWPGEDAPAKQDETVRVWKAERISQPAEGEPHPRSTVTPGREVPRPIGEPMPSITRSTEDQRLQELADRLNRIAVVESSPAALRVAPPLAAKVTRQPAKSGRVARLLHDPRHVRDAIILSEVLGPPVSSRQ